MTCRIIDGAAIAAVMRTELKEKIERTRIRPSLVALLVGVEVDPASEIYVNKKMVAAAEVGIKSRIERSDCFSLGSRILRLNDDDEVHGYILQLPLPDGLNPLHYFDLINPEKDVDVFSPINVGLLVQHRPRFKPCTPAAIQTLLHRSGIRVAGKRVAVINRSNVVGKPLSSMLIQECDDYANATVTVCHDRTPPEILKEITLQSDIVVVAVGKPGFLTADMVKPGSVVVDVGITRIGKKVLGDVSVGVREVAGWVSQVPGGVGPLTIMMLLENTFHAAYFARHGNFPDLTL